MAKIVIAAVLFVISLLVAAFFSGLKTSRRVTWWNTPVHVCGVEAPRGLAIVEIVVSVIVGVLVISAIGLSNISFALGVLATIITVAVDAWVYCSF